MNIVITGGTGFVGRHLAGALLGRGDRVLVLGRTARPAGDAPDGSRLLAADTTRPGDWQEHVSAADAVVNLAGATIFRRWTKARKQEIRDSRILTTRNLVAALPRERSVTLVSASAVGYYGSAGERPLEEAAEGGDDFLARLAVDWEEAAEEAAAGGARVVRARFGVVLARDGGAMGQMLPAFRFFLGGPLGNGRQWFPWIHMADLVGGLLFALDTPALAGPVNFTAPRPVRNRDFAAALGRALRRPACLPVPAFVLRLALGEFAEALLASQRVMPARLAAAGFDFRYPDIDSALAEIVGAPDRTGPGEGSA